MHFRDLVNTQIVSYRLKLVAQMVTFYPVQLTGREVTRGASLFEGLAEHPLYDRRFLYLVKVGRNPAGWT